MKKQSNEKKYINYKKIKILKIINNIFSIMIIILSVLSLMKKISFIYPSVLFIINTLLVKYEKSIEKK